jgi:hypothetical protein
MEQVRLDNSVDDPRLAVAIRRDHADIARNGGLDGTNLVERFFADLTADVIRSGSFASIGELVRDIEAYLSDRNAAPKPYTWKAEGAAILEKINRARAALEKVEAA